MVILGVAVLLLAIGVGVAWRARFRSLSSAHTSAGLRLTRSLLRSLDQGVVIADRQGEIQVVNRAARGMVGSLANTVSRRGWAASGGEEIVGSQGAPEALGSLPIARAVAGERFDDEEVFVRRAAESTGLWLLVSGAPLRSRRGEPEGGFVVFRDITAKKDQDDSVKRLTAAVDKSAETIFITDCEGRILYVNEGFEKTSGYSRSEALGKTPRILNSGVHDAEHFRRLWDTILRGDVYRGTTINRRRDGSTWYGEQSVTPVRDTQGQVRHFVSVAQDMTERRLLLEHEAAMRVAGIIQRRLYPVDTPRYATLDVAGAAFPLEITCGDYFDVIPLPDGAVALAIGDVSGHGIGPALIMVEARAHLRSLLGAGFSVAEAMGRLNRILCDDIPADRFVSLLVVRIEGRPNRMTYVNAGHTGGLFMGRSGAACAELDPTGPALGLIADACYGTGEESEMEEGDVLVLVTDGITELHAPTGELFEWPRVVDVVRKNRTRDARGIVKAMHDAALTFAAGQPADDDLTLLVCRVTSDEAQSDAASVPSDTGAAVRVP
ncbi:MAG: SpoIIE family protein phosphatase [Planctomycetota bacterium]|nr:SpoIIE family protein phosphatase [Planctomycetota bacterium]